MRIGILTLRLHTNYGGILQTYALQTILERMGHDVIVFNQDRRPLLCSKLGVLYCFLYRCLVTLKNRRILRYYNVNKEMSAPYKEFLFKTQFTQKFVDKWIHSKYVRSYVEEIPQADVDCIIVGSDQIWDRSNGDSIDGSVSNAFLPFLSDKIKRFSYAASFGHDGWRYSEEQTMIAKNALKAFSGVSVREISGLDLCKNFLNCEAQVHVDPTMLLKSEDYVANFGLQSVEPSLGDMLVYVLDGTPEKDEIVGYVEDILHLTCFRVNSRAEDRNYKSTSIADEIQPPVERWLRGFMDAKFVVTDSFHACVFSIIFHKPFLAIGNKERGYTRFVTLLSKFGMEERLVENVEDVKKIDCKKEVDSSMVEVLLESERQKTKEYLQKNLCL